MTSRFIFFLALLFTAASAGAADVTPAPAIRYVDLAANLEVSVVKGGGTVFKGYTDERGRFETTPLEPGVYIFQLRIPKTMITPARYTLALSGARPLGDALVGGGVALALNAEVRRSGPVRGHVNGRRVIIVPAPAPLTAGAATPSPTVNRPVATRTMATPPRSGINSTMTSTATQSAPARSSVAAAPVNRTAVATPSPTMNNPAVTRTMATPPRSSISSVPTATSTASLPLRATLASTASSTAPAPPRLVPRPANSQPRIVNGRRYVWVASAPNSNLGYWAPDNIGVQPANAARTNVPTAQPVRAPSPSPTPRRY